MPYSTWMMFGVDGCRGGWIAFKVDLSTGLTTVEPTDLVNTLRQRPPDLACLAIDIPIGLMDGPRECNAAARKLLGKPRGSSVFPPPCRAAVQAATYNDACTVNKERADTKLSVFTWGIVPKIRQGDDAITPKCQSWAVEVHPEVCFWALAGGRPMTHRKKIADGVKERLDLLRPVFPDIDQHLLHRPSGVGKDDLLDAAVAAWTALSFHRNEARSVCTPKVDAKGLAAAIWY